MNRLLPGSSDKQAADTSNKDDVIETSSNLPKLNFPAKLHLILSTPEFNDIICWLPHGRAWRVQQQDKLESEILPKFFQHQKAASFYRQVTGWGFHRVVSGTDFNAYYHELFLRDAPDLCRKMKRPTRTELSERKQNLSKVPPDFYVMPPVSEETADPSYTSVHQMTLDEHKDMLVRRLSTYSLTEKGMYLQLELNKLEKKKDEIMTQLKTMGASTLPSAGPPATAGPPPPSSNFGNSSSIAHQLQQHQATMNTIPTPSHLDHPLLNNLQHHGASAGAPSMNPFHHHQPSSSAPPSLLNNPSAVSSAPTIDQLRLELLQQMQQLQQQQPSSILQRPPDTISQLALANILLGGGGAGAGAGAQFNGANGGGGGGGLEDQLQQLQQQQQRFNR